MPYNTKSIKKDVDNKPIPQIFDMVKDDYEVLQGRNGAQRVEIYGPDGDPVSVVSNKLAVRASEVETLLNDIKGKDFATQATLAEVLAKLSDDPATQTTLEAILAKIIDAPATEAKQDALAALIGEVQATPTANTLLARLKSLEDKIAAIDSVLDAIVDGSTPAVTQLSGSKMELYGVAIEDRPDANTVAVGATFTIVDDTGNFDSYISNGTDWLEV